MSSGAFGARGCTNIQTRHIMKGAAAVETNHFLNSAFSKSRIIFSLPETLRLAQTVSNGSRH